MTYIEFAIFTFIHTDKQAIRRTHNIRPNVQFTLEQDDQHILLNGTQMSLFRMHKIFLRTLKEQRS